MVFKDKIIIIIIWGDQLPFGDYLSKRQEWSHHYFRMEYPRTSWNDT